MQVVGAVEVGVVVEEEVAVEAEVAVGGDVTEVVVLVGQEDGVLSVSTQVFSCPSSQTQNNTHSKPNVLTQLEIESKWAVLSLHPLPESRSLTRDRPAHLPPAIQSPKGASCVDSHKHSLGKYSAPHRTHMPAFNQ